MRFQDWIGKRSHLGRECREERIQNLTDQWWQAKVDQNYDLADHIKDELNIKYDTVVMESSNPDAEEIEKLLRLFRNARMSGQNEMAAEYRRILSDKYDIAIFS